MNTGGHRQQQREVKATTLSHAACGPNRIVVTTVKAICHFLPALYELVRPMAKPLRVSAPDTVNKRTGSTQIVSDQPHHHRVVNAGSSTDSAPADTQIKSPLELSPCLKLLVLAASVHSGNLLIYVTCTLQPILHSCLLSVSMAPTK